MVLKIYNSVSLRKFQLKSCEDLKIYLILETIILWHFCTCYTRNTTTAMMIMMIIVTLFGIILCIYKCVLIFTVSYDVWICNGTERDTDDKSSSASAICPINIS